MDDIDLLGGNQSLQPLHIQRHHQRIFGLGGKPHPYAALGLQVADQPPAIAGDQRAGAGVGERGGDIDGGALRAAGVKLGNELQNGAPRQLRGAVGAKGGLHARAGHARRAT